MKHSRILRLGRRHYPKSDHRAYWHVALVLSHGRVISIATNFGWRHAEERAISQIPPEHRAGCTIYSLRYGQSGHARNAKPCPNCSRLIEQNGLKRVYYSNEVGEIQELIA